MSYQVLARKWRPRNFKELVGQLHVLQALVNALDNNRLHHAYLFTGTRGVGKTTIARILAKCLNCETGVTSEPCGQCSACTEIDEGRFVDLIEVDAASRTRLEDTKELLDNVQYTPTRGRFKVYLIDEVHMLSTHSFNALLKTLEEPPPHIKFLLATTDPHKLPVTILSRCLQFSLKNMPSDKIVEHLLTVLQGEGIPFEKPALWQIGRAADGSMRDALSLTDQAIAYCGATLTSQGVTAMLGTIDQDQVYRILDALVSQQAGNVLQAVAELAEHGPDYVAVLADMLCALHRMALAQALPNSIDNSQGDRDRILGLAGKITAEDIQLYYQTGLIGRRDLPLAPEPRAGFEMVLLRMLAFRPDGLPGAPTTPLPPGGSPSATPPHNSCPNSGQGTPPAQPAAADKQTGEPEGKQDLTGTPSRGVDASEKTAIAAPLQPEDIQPPPPDAGHSNTSANATAPTQPKQPKQPGAIVTAHVALADQGSGSQRPSDGNGKILQTAPLPEAGKALPALQTNGQQQKHLPVTNSNNSAPSRGDKIPLEELLPESWIAVSEALDLGGVTGAIVSHCELASVHDSQIVLRLDRAHDTLYGGIHRLRIQDALTEYFGAPITLAVETGTIQAETPAGYRERMHQQRLAMARESFIHDDQVQAIVNTFSGKIQEHTIEPVK